MAFDDGQVTRIFHDLKAARVFDQRLSLLHLLQRISAASVIEKLEIPNHLRLWEDSGTLDIHNFQWRIGIIEAACSHIHHVPVDEHAVSCYLDLASKACEWGANISGTVDGGRSSLDTQALKHVQTDIVLLSTGTLAAADQCANLVGNFGGMGAFLTSSLNFVKNASLRTRLQHVSDSPEGKFAEICAKLIDSASTYLLKLRETLATIVITTSSEKKHVNSTVEKHKHILALAIGNLVQVANASAGSGYLQVLNACWKALVSLLQPKQGCQIVWAEEVDICNVIIVLVEQALQKLKVTLDSSVISPSDPITSPVADCKGVRSIKFFVTYAVRIARWYPKQAGGAHKIIAQFATKLFATLSLQPEFLHHTDLKKALCEIVWPVTCMLLHTVLNSENVERDQKSQLLLGIVNGYSSRVEYSSGETKISVIEKLFPSGEKRMSGVHGKVGCASLYLNLLLISSGYKSDVLLELCKHLDWLVDTLAQEEVYSTMVELQTFPKHTKESTYTSNMQMMFVWALQALETFATVAAASGVLVEIEQFLFRNAMHPFGLCAELIKDVWCFLFRHGHQSLITGHVSAAFNLLQTMCFSRTGMDSEIPLQRIARLLCSLLKAAPETEALRICLLTYNEESFRSPSTATLAHLLLQEGFSFALLPEHRRKPAILQLTDTCLSVLSELSQHVELEGASNPSEAHQRAAACLLEVLRLYTEIGEELGVAKKEEIAKVCLGIVQLSLRQGERGCSAENIAIVAQALKIFQYVQQALSTDDLRDLLIWLERNVCFAASQDVGMKLILWPALAEFLGNLSHVDFQEDGQDPMTQALWNLYHIVLQEEHWALFHAGLASFGKFASSTCMGELWRFLPATLTTEDESSAEDLFMNALQVFLEKQQGRPHLDIDTEERGMLRMECKKQKTAAFAESYVSNVTACRIEEQHGVSPMQLDECPTRPFVDEAVSSEICKGLAMLQEGVQLLQDKLPLWLLNKPVRDSEQYELLTSQLVQIHGQVGSLAQL